MVSRQFFAKAKGECHKGKNAIPTRFQPFPSISLLYQTPSFPINPLLFKEDLFFTIIKNLFLCASTQMVHKKKTSRLINWKGHKYDSFQPHFQMAFPSKKGTCIHSESQVSQIKGNILSGTKWHTIAKSSEHWSEKPPPPVGWMHPVLATHPLHFKLT